jgi:hypothetical protein
MRLILHPDSACQAVQDIHVTALRGPGGRLTLAYRTTGMPMLGTAAGTMRADDLWKHTCFEAFVRPAAGEAYYEFNFSPHLRWAAYRFEGYRRARQDAVIARPAIKALRGGDALELAAELELGGIPDLGGDWRVGISAVIEEANGNVSYWALKHPPDKADFHQSDGFALELPAI